MTENNKESLENVMEKTENTAEEILARKLQGMTSDSDSISIKLQTIAPDIMSIKIRSHGQGKFTTEYESEIDLSSFTEAEIDDILKNFPDIVSVFCSTQELVQAMAKYTNSVVHIDMSRASLWPDKKRVKLQVIAFGDTLITSSLILGEALRLLSVHGDRTTALRIALATLDTVIATPTASSETTDIIENTSCRCSCQDCIPHRLRTVPKSDPKEDTSDDEPKVNQ